MKTSQLLQKISSLHLRFDPSWIDGCPGCPGPVINEALGDYLVAQMLREIAARLKTKKVAEGLHGLAKEMVVHSSKGLVAGWEEGDDFCPPHWPFPFPKPGPDPAAWFNRYEEYHFNNPTELVSFSPAMEELQLAGALRSLATLTQNQKFSEQIFSFGQQVVKGAASRVFDEYCGTVPRPRPKPHYANVALNKGVAQFG